MEAREVYQNDTSRPRPVRHCAPHKPNSSLWLPESIEADHYTLKNAAQLLREPVLIHDVVDGRGIVLFSLRELAEGHIYQTENGCELERLSTRKAELRYHGVKCSLSIPSAKEVECKLHSS